MSSFLCLHRSVQKAVRLTREISEKGAIPFDEYDTKVESKVIEINHPEERAPNPGGRVVPSFAPC